MNQVKRGFLLVVLLSGLGCIKSPRQTTHQTPAETWHEYKPTDAGYRILFPGKPRRDTKMEGSTRVTMDSYSERKRSYFVHWYDIPRTGRLNMKASADSYARFLEGKVVSSEECSIRDYPGLKFEIEFSDGNAKGYYVLVKQRAYQVFVIGDDVQQTQPDVQKFLDSFGLLP